jgi:DNA-directed RNA polymerase specialized sigma24 family protein
MNKKKIEIYITDLLISGELYRRSHAIINASRSDIEDIVSISIIKALKASDRYKDNNFLAYLLTIIRRTHLNSLRYQKTYESYKNIWTLYKDHDDINDSDLYQHLIHDLNKDEIDLLNLIIAGYKADEIAIFLNVKYRTALKRVNLIREKSRKAYYEQR